MRLAKRHLDIGMFATSIDQHHAFWEKEVGFCQVVSDDSI